MRHGFGPLSGHFMGYGDGGVTIFGLLVVTLAIALIAIWVDRSRKKSHPEHARLLSPLKDKYARREIGAAEYRERNMILDDEYWLDEDCPDMLRLKKRYARCEIDSRGFVKQREELKAIRDGASSASFNERPVQ